MWDDFFSYHFFICSLSNQADKWIAVVTNRVLFCAISWRLTCGAENTLFHYLSWDSFHGIVICPSDGDAPATRGVVHAEVVNTFHKTCLSMRRLFSPYYKQVGWMKYLQLLYICYTKGVVFFLSHWLKHWLYVSYFKFSSSWRFTCTSRNKTVFSIIAFKRKGSEDTVCVQRNARCYWARCTVSSDARQCNGAEEDCHSPQVLGHRVRVYYNRKSVEFLVWGYLTTKLHEVISWVEPLFEINNATLVTWLNYSPSVVPQLV